jgi:hypothetical protein
MSSGETIGEMLANFKQTSKQSGKIVQVGDLFRKIWENNQRNSKSNWKIQRKIRMNTIRKL